MKLNEWRRWAGLRWVDVAEGLDLSLRQTYRVNAATDLSSDTVRSVYALTDGMVTPNDLYGLHGKEGLS